MPDASIPNPVPSPRMRRTRIQPLLSRLAIRHIHEASAYIRAVPVLANWAVLMGCFIGARFLSRLYPRTSLNSQQNWAWWWSQQHCRNKSSLTHHYHQAQLSCLGTHGQVGRGDLVDPIYRFQVTGVGMTIRHPHLPRNSLL